MKIEDNLDSHKISDEFKFRQDRSIHIGLTCFWVPKTPYLTLSGAYHVIFIQSLWNLQINRTGIKYSTSWKLDHIALFTLELHALDCCHIGSQVSDRCLLGFLLRLLWYAPWRTKELILNCNYRQKRGRWDRPEPVRKELQKPKDEDRYSPHFPTASDDSPPPQPDRAPPHPDRATPTEQETVKTSTDHIAQEPVTMQETSKGQTEAKPDLIKPEPADLVPPVNSAVEKRVLSAPPPPLPPLPAEAAPALPPLPMETEEPMSLPPSDSLPQTDASQGKESNTCGSEVTQPGVAGVKSKPLLPAVIKADLPQATAGASETVQRSSQSPGKPPGQKSTKESSRSRSKSSSRSRSKSHGKSKKKEDKSKSKRKDEKKRSQRSSSRKRSPSRRESTRRSSSPWRSRRRSPSRSPVKSRRSPPRRRSRSRSVRRGRRRSYSRSLSPRRYSPVPPRRRSRSPRRRRSPSPRRRYSRSRSR